MPSPSGESHSSPSLLLVDDNPANFLAIRSILDELNVLFVEAQSGEEALQQAQRDDFAVILLDVVMPGMSGFETAERLRHHERTRHTPIIFLTAGDVDQRELEEGYRLGAVDFIVKPLLPVVLRAKVRGFVNLFNQQHRAQREAEQLRILVDGTPDYAIFLLDPQGRVASWNSGAQRLKGYQAVEIIGEHFSRFYTAAANEVGWPQHELVVASAAGRIEDEGWRVRKDGTTFWANVVITALRDEGGELRGFSKVTRDMTERKLAEENARRLAEESVARSAAEEHARLMQQQREQFRVTLASIGDAVISTDAEGRIAFLNPVAESLIGQLSAEAANRPLGEVLQIVDEETRQPVENPAFRALQDGITIGPANHTLLVAGNGEERPIDDSAAPIRDSQGQVIGSVLVFRDISERKQSHAALLESEGRFRGLMQQAPFSIQVFAPSGQTVSVNQAWEQLWGLTLEQLQDYNILQDRQLEAKGILPTLRRAFAGEAVKLPAMEYDPNDSLPGQSSHSDSVRWVSAVAYPLRDDAGKVREVVLVHDDITARKRAEDERERFSFLVENSRDFIGVCDLDFRPYFINREGLRLVGLESVEQTRGISLIEFFFEEDRDFMLNEFFPRVLREGHGEVEVRFRHFKTGRPIWFAYSVVLMQNDAREPAGYATISRDISRLKEANEALQAADRRKDEFLATLAHELRNPLAPIRNALQILKMPRVDAETAAQTRDTMERQVHHLVRLVDDLLDVSRVMRGKIDLRREVVELATLVARAVETVQSLIEVQHHRLNIELPRESLRLDADPMRVVQIVANLLTNAAKYTETGGEITIAARRIESAVALSVRDTGIGIAPEMLPHVFELFVQADYAATRSQGGLGIGLTLVKSLVEMHGGTVEAHSAGLGKGSEFVVSLPLVATDADDALAAPETTFVEAGRSGFRVLIADDNRDAASTLGLLLRLHGHEVHVAADGRSALDLAKAIRPDIVFLDIGMPDMDGYEVARQLRAMPELAGVVLAALTGWGQAEDRRRSAAAGFDHHLVKPAEPAKLLQLFAQLKS